MHETGIAASILEIAEAEAARHGACAISAIRVRVGDFSNVVPEALEFSFEALKAGTPAAEARLEIIRIPLTAHCSNCRTTITPEGPLILWCPRCQGPLEILTGKELEVESVDLEESEAACSEFP